MIVDSVAGASHNSSGSEATNDKQLSFALRLSPLAESHTTLLAIYDQNGNLLQRYSYADERVPYKLVYNGESYYLFYNHLGSLRAVADSQGKVVAIRVSR